MGGCLKNLIKPKISTNLFFYHYFLTFFSERESVGLANNLMSRVDRSKKKIKEEMNDILYK